MTICNIAWGLVRDSIYWDDLYTPVYVVWFTLNGWINGSPNGVEFPVAIIHMITV